MALLEPSLGAKLGPSHHTASSIIQQQSKGRQAHTNPNPSSSSLLTPSGEVCAQQNIPVERQRARVVNGYASKAYGFGRSGSNPLVVDYFCRSRFLVPPCLQDVSSPLRGISRGEACHRWSNNGDFSRRIYAVMPAIRLNHAGYVQPTLSNQSRGGIGRMKSTWKPLNGPKNTMYVHRPTLRRRHTARWDNERDSLLATALR